MQPASPAAEAALFGGFQRDPFFDLAPIGFLTLDARGRIIEFNRRSVQMLRLPSNWLLHCPFSVFVAKHHVRRLLRYLSADEMGGSRQHTFELDLSIERQVVPVQMSLLTTSGELTIYQVAIVDLSDAKRAQRELQSSLARWRSLVQHAPDSILILERSGRITFVNTDLWGYAPSALIGKRIFDYISESERPKLRRALQQAFRCETRSECEIERDLGAERHCFTFSCGPAQTEGDRAVTTVTIRDISERKRKDEALRKSREQLRDLAARLEAVREDERLRIARELHDDLGQALTILKIDLSWMLGKLKSVDAGMHGRVKSMIGHVDDTIGRVWRLSSNLRPPVLDDLGFAAAIEWQAAEFEKHTGIETRIDFESGEPALSKEASVDLFRAAQEALTNVARHANATRVNIHLKRESGVLIFSVQDNGKGVTAEQINNVKSLGIVGIRERIARLGGEFNISSESGQGTRLDMTIPYDHDKNMP